MREKIQAGILVLGLGLLIATPAPAGKPPETPAHIAKGKAIYERSCLLCHGAKGEGDGPAAFFIASYGAPRPQNLRMGNFKFRSTPYGILPTDADLFRTVTRGVPGFMPTFRGLTEEERWAVIYYVKSFNPKFQEADPQRAEIEIGTPSRPSRGHLALGRKLYHEAGCGNCHGEDGKGDGPSVPTLKDYRGFHIPPADLTRPSSFKNGSKPEDIYRTIMTGLTGTPMISFASVFAGREDKVWHLVHYILSLSER
jgi:cytochrome c oxidase cbb3-type subunit 2